MHRCPARRVFSGTRLELVTKPATIRYLYHSATAATRSRERALDGENLRRALKKETWSEIGVERKERL
ncbi:hypothetical protein TNCV_3827661 [Trichonephila clavipes]|nr:hypothetical protein TNCV_3827661 [Trichonephila clavipes]